MFQIKNFRLLLTMIFFVPFSMGFAQMGNLPLSPLQSINQQIANTNISVTYSRPSVRGRTIFGALVPYGEIWRTGANKNTLIHFNQAVQIQNQTLPKGTYSIFSKPFEKEWEVYFYTDIENNGTPKVWDSTKIIAQLKVPSILQTKKTENFTIFIEDMTDENFNLTFIWENTSVSVPISLSEKGKLDNHIEKVLSGPKSVDYFAAAQYMLEDGDQYQKALEWINKSIALRSKEVYWDYRVKSLILIKLNKPKEAYKAATKGLQLAKQKPSRYGIQAIENILKSLSK